MVAVSGSGCRFYYVAVADQCRLLQNYPATRICLFRIGRSIPEDVTKFNNLTVYTSLEVPGVRIGGFLIRVSAVGPVNNWAELQLPDISLQALDPVDIRLGGQCYY